MVKVEIKDFILNAVTEYKVSETFEFSSKSKVEIYDIGMDYMVKYRGKLYLVKTDEVQKLRKFCKSEGVIDGKYTERHF